MIYSIPNLITYGRVILIPAMVVFLALMNPQASPAENQPWALAALFVFVVAGVSDIIDGYYARKTNSVSVMGKFMDPMADKLIHMATMVMLIPLHRLPAWLVVVLLFREILVTGLRASAAGEGLVIPAATWGKYKTAWLNCGLGCMIYYQPLAVGSLFELNIFAIGVTCLAIGLGFSLASAVVYARDFFLVMKNRASSAS